jgi:hypothetical protein|tara:strand:- start:821 stop:1021 length:201 start_codon:yes stop_codon:yes gene_type:complete
MEEHRHLDSTRAKSKEESQHQHPMPREAVDCPSEIVNDKRLAKTSSPKHHQGKSKVLPTDERTEAT